MITGLTEFCDLSHDAVDKVYQTSTHTLSADIIDDSPIDTSAFARSWTPSIGEGYTVDVSPQTARITGSFNDLVKPVTNKLKAGKKYNFLNGKDYALPLEYGHSRQAPSGVLRINVAKWETKHVPNAVQKFKV